MQYIYLLPLLAAGQSFQAEPAPPTSAQDTQEGVSSAFWWSDFDGDHLQDGFVITQEGDAKLLRNAGDGSFWDVSESAGMAALRGARFGEWKDYDGDGHTDLFIGTHAGASYLLHNEGDGSFSDRASEAGLAHTGLDVSAHWLDFDADGRPDLHVRTKQGNHIYHNVGRGMFETVDLGDFERYADAGTAPAHSAAAPGEDTAIAGARATEGGVDADRTLWRRDQKARTGRTPAVARPTLKGDTPSSGNPENLSLFCAEFIRDQSTNQCIEASSVGTLGRLYPLSSDFNVNSIGNIGVGTTTPLDRLHVNNGDLQVSGAAGREILLRDGQGDVAIRLDASPDGLSNNLQLYRDGKKATEALNVSQGMQNYIFNTTTNNPSVFFGVANTDRSGFLIVSSDTGDNNVRLDADFSSDAAKDGAVWVRSTGGGAGGRFIAANDDGATRLLISGGGPGDGGELEARNSAGQATIVLEGEAGTGGNIEMMEDSGTRTVEIDSDASNAARIELWDANNGVNSLLIDARDGSDGGARIRLTGSTSQNTVEIDGLEDGAGQLRLGEEDGSGAFHMVGDQFVMANSAGAVTVAFNRQTGSKNGVLSTDDFGQRLLYCMESPEVWFEDIGEGQLQGGSVRIDIDPILLQTVTINEEHPMQVFITPTSQCNGVFVERGRDHFVVRELAGGSSDATFSWRLVAKRKGLENARLEAFDQAAVMGEMEPESAPADEGDAAASRFVGELEGPADGAYSKE